MLAKLPSERQCLLDAATLIEDRGHCKGTRKDQRGAYCVMGAISVAKDGDPFSVFTDDPPGKLLASYVHMQPVHWNNMPERTKDEVVTALRGAALHGL